MGLVKVCCAAAIGLALVVVSANAASAASDPRADRAGAPERKDTVYLPPCSTSDPDVCSDAVSLLGR